MHTCAGDGLVVHLRSLINQRRPPPHGLYHGGIGIVLSPLSRLRCAYPQDSGSKSWLPNKASLPGCGPRLCTSLDAPFPVPANDRGYVCAFPPSMLADMLEVFDRASAEMAAYNEVVVDSSTDAFAIEAIVGSGDDATRMHANTLRRFGLNARQLPLVQFGPGMKEAGPIFTQTQA